MLSWWIRWLPSSGFCFWTSVFPRPVQCHPGYWYVPEYLMTGKLAPAGGSDGYRAIGTAAGPQSSQGTYQATQDIGKMAPAGGSDGYRSLGTAAGPQSSHTNYEATQDIGKQVSPDFRQAAACCWLRRLPRLGQRRWRCPRGCLLPRVRCQGRRRRVRRPTWRQVLLFVRR